MLGDDVVITGHYFEPNGHVDNAATLCLSTNGQCAERGLNPFTKDPTGAGVPDHRPLALSPCQVREELSLSARNDLTAIVSQDGVEREFILPMPEPLEAVFGYHRDGDTFSLTVDTQRNITQALAWAEQRDQGRIVWTSESSPEAMAIGARHFEVRIPKEISTDCSDCRIVVQVAGIYDRASIGVYAEDRGTIDVAQLLE